MNKISVVIPTYNRKEFVQVAIESVLAQTYKNVEIVVVDNNSEDGTYSFLADKYQNCDRVLLYRNKTNIGPVNNWIEGIKHTSGDYVKLLFSDDYLEPDYLEKTSELLDTYNDCGVVFSAVKLINDKGDVLGKTYTSFHEGLRPKEEYLDKLTEREKIGELFPVSPGCALFRRKYLKIDKYIKNENAIKFEDTGAGIDLYSFLYAIDECGCFGYVKDALSVFRCHEGSISSNPICDFQYDYAAYLYYKNYKGKALLEDMIKAIAIRRMQTGYSYAKYKEYNDYVKKMVPDIKTDYLFELFQNERWKEQKRLEVNNKMMGLFAEYVLPVDDVKKRLTYKNIHNIAIYGLSNLGKCLAVKLKESGVNVRYFVDRKPVRDNYAGIKVLSINDSLEPVDITIVTTVYCFDEICKIKEIYFATSIEHFINEIVK